MVGNEGFEPPMGDSESHALFIMEDPNGTSNIYMICVDQLMNAVYYIF